MREAIDVVERMCRMDLSAPQPENRFRMTARRASCGRWIFQEDSTFDVKAHFTKLHEHVLHHAVESVMREPMAMDRPLWHAYYVERCGPNGKTCLLLKYHQALGDGMAMLRVLAERVCDRDRPSRLDSQMVGWIKPRYGHVAFVTHAASACFAAPLYLLGDWLSRTSMVSFFFC